MRAGLRSGCHSTQVGCSHPGRGGGVEQRCITSDDDEIGVVDTLGTGEVHGVVAPKPMTLGQLADPAGRRARSLELLGVRGRSLVGEPLGVVEREPQLPKLLAVEQQLLLGADLVVVDRIVDELGILPEVVGFRIVGAHAQLLWFDVSARVSLRTYLPVCCGNSSSGGCSGDPPEGAGDDGDVVAPPSSFDRVPPHRGELVGGGQAGAFYDVGGVVYFLRLVPWIVPRFTVASYRDALRRLHDVIERHGTFETTSTRTLIEATKPA